jgi:hypothetical protein
MPKTRLTALQAIAKLQQIDDDDSDVDNENDADFADVDGEDSEASDFSLVPGDDSSSSDSDDQNLIDQHIEESIETVMNRAFIDDGESVYRAKDDTVWHRLQENDFTLQRNRINFKEY